MKLGVAAWEMKKAASSETTFWSEIIRLYALSTQTYELTCYPFAGSSK